MLAGITTLFLRLAPGESRGEVSIGRAEPLALTPQPHWWVLLCTRTQAGLEQESDGAAVPVPTPLPSSSTAWCQPAAAVVPPFAPALGHSTRLSSSHVPYSSLTAASLADGQTHATAWHM